jgi:hypothetical protein
VGDLGVCAIDNVLVFDQRLGRTASFLENNWRGRDICKRARCVALDKQQDSCESLPSLSQRDRLFFG